MPGGSAAPTSSQCQLGRVRNERVERAAAQAGSSEPTRLRSPGAREWVREAKCEGRLEAKDVSALWRPGETTSGSPKGERIMSSRLPRDVVISRSSSCPILMRRRVRPTLFRQQRYSLRDPVLLSEVQAHLCADDGLSVSEQMRERPASRTFPGLPQRREFRRLVVRLLSTSRKRNMSRPVAARVVTKAISDALRSDGVSLAAPISDSLARPCRPLNVENLDRGVRRVHPRLREEVVELDEDGWRAGEGGRGRRSR